MSPSVLHGSEDLSGLHHILSTSITPLDVGGISLLEDGDGLSIDDKLPVLHLDCAIDLAMGGIILEHVDHVVKVNEGVIEGDSVHFARIKSSPGDEALNAAESFTLIFTILSQGCGWHSREVAAICQMGRSRKMEDILKLQAGLQTN